MIKVWKLNDFDWVLAKTLEEAKQCYANTVSDGVVDKEFEEEFIDSPHEETDLDTKMILDDNEEERCSFRVEVERMVKNGDTFPCMFVSSEY